MKRLPLLLSTAILAGFALFGGTACSTISKLQVTSAQAIAIGEPIEAGALTLVLQKNPSYIPLARTVGTALATANWTDVTQMGINAAVDTAVAKAGGTLEEAVVISAALQAGLGGYLGAVAETDLSKDPNAVLVLQALGQGIVAAVAAVSPPA